MTSTKMHGIPVYYLRWKLGIELKLFDSSGVDHVFVDHPMFLERVCYFATHLKMLIEGSSSPEFYLSVYSRSGEKLDPKSIVQRQESITRTTNFNIACCARLLWRHLGFSI